MIESGAPEDRSLNVSAEKVDAVIAEVAKLLSQQKLIPFFGAGISRPHLGFAAEELARQMATEIGADPGTLLSVLSDKFEDERGSDAFVDFLRERLVVPVLNDDRAATHRLLLSLSQNVLYTTNQDNIFELTAKRYGRPYQRVVTLDDLSNAVPGERLLIKFHGDTDVSDSLVFGARSYQARIEATDHPLDIRLRSDLLGKRLLFVGYSFSDENITKLFDAIRLVFRGNMPPSYLIAFEYSSAMDDLKRNYGITIIEPRRLFTDAISSGDAFERCLKEICDRTVALQAEMGFETMFSSGKLNPRMVTDYEINAVAGAVETGSFESALSAFRGAFDQAIVPQPMHARVTELFSTLADKVDADDDKQMSDLRGALFNFRLPIDHALQATAGMMAACNRRKPRDSIDSVGFILCPALPDHTLSVAAACAVAILRQRNEAIGENFRRFATSWFEGAEDLDPAIRDNVNLMIAEAWRGSGSMFRPMGRSAFRQKGYHEIVAELQNNLPRRFKNPER